MKLITLLLSIGIVPTISIRASEKVHLLVPIQPASPYMPLREAERLKLVEEATHEVIAERYDSPESSARRKNALNKLFPKNGPWDRPSNPIKSCCVHANKKSCCTSSVLYDLCCGAGFFASISVGLIGVLNLDTYSSVGADMLFGAIGSGTCIAFAYPCCKYKCNYGALNHLSNPNNWDTKEEEGIALDKPQPIEMREDIQ